MTGTVREENCTSVLNRGEPLRLDLKLFATYVANEANSDIKTEEVFKLSTQNNRKIILLIFLFGMGPKFNKSWTHRQQEANISWLTRTD